MRLLKMTRGGAVQCVDPSTMLILVSFVCFLLPFMMQKTPDAREEVEAPAVVMASGKTIETMLIPCESSHLKVG